MKNVYLLFSEDCTEYKRIFKTLDGVVNAIYEDFIEEDNFINKNDIKNHIQKREEKGYIYLFFATEIDETINENSYCGSYRVQKCIVE